MLAFDTPATMALSNILILSSIEEFETALILLLLELLFVLFAERCSFTLFLGSLAASF
jgi:hypothetical protein